MLLQLQTDCSSQCARRAATAATKAAARATQLAGVAIHSRSKPHNSGTDGVGPGALLNRSRALMHISCYADMLSLVYDAL